ncbi:MAG: type II secretion system protein GspD [Sedimentisphaerales bacterium]|nr:type II secretion system protein GspD [Sedimentisphaerales bacterium]
MTHDQTARTCEVTRVSMGASNGSVGSVLLSAPVRAILRRAVGVSPPWIAGILALCLMLLAGCASKTKSEKTVTLEEPQVANGEIIDDDDPLKLKEFSDAVDAMDLQTPSDAQALAPAESAAGAETAAPARIGVAEAVNMTAAKAVPPESTALIALPKLSVMELTEIADHVALVLETELGYGAASSAVADALPTPPSAIIGGRTLARPGEGGTHVLRFGYRHYVSQPPQAWIIGVIVGKDGTLSANPDLARIEPEITKTIAELNKMRTGLTIRDLEAKLIQLSYVDAEAALGMLKGMGVTTMSKPTELPPQVDFSKLPYVVNIEDPKKEYTGLVGAKTQTTGSKLSLTPGVAAEMTDNAIASPTNQLLVLFHPAHAEQFSEVRRILDDLIDRPARQIFIDAMVLEISETGLRDLGVEWDLVDNPLGIGLTAGSEKVGTEGDEGDTLRLDILETSNLSDLFEAKMNWDWNVLIRALIRTGKAEVLSRPSVLTLNNRQSTIRVGRDIPIASSLQGNFGGKISFSFEYLPVGILLNIRPRINESGAEVSMLIDTIVSARVPNADLQLKDVDGKTVLAEAPTVSTRRVQTYGRIPNNTPLIIGGLVSKENTLTMDKVPLLGDLPLVGMFFRAEQRDNEKREVIIVLTPHVLPSDEHLRRSLPKDEDAFDNFGNKLFRDSYRIRAEDVFDLTFLLQNRRIATYRDMAREAATKNFRLGQQEPFRSFVRDSVPGESIFVTRMIYEVIKRLNTADIVKDSRIIYFKSQQVGGYNVKFLEGLLKNDGEDTMKDFGDQALAITYHYDRDSLEEGRLGSEPIPEISMVDCPDRDAWGTKLWELNQPTPDGQEHHTILIQNEDDVLRLRRALVLKRIAVLNGGDSQMRLRNFSVGKVLLMPELKPDQIHVIDADTARFFFHTEHYYAAALAEIEEQLKELDQRLRRPDISILLESGRLEENSVGENQ